MAPSRHLKQAETCFIVSEYENLPRFVCLSHWTAGPGNGGRKPHEQIPRTALDSIHYSVGLGARGIFRAPLLPVGREAQNNQTGENLREPQWSGNIGFPLLLLLPRVRGAVALPL